MVSITTIKKKSTLQRIRISSSADCVSESKTVEMVSDRKGIAMMNHFSPEGVKRFRSGGHDCVLLLSRKKRRNKPR